jgi:hypothetical protein
MASVVELLREMSRLLDEYGFEPQATYLSRLANVYGIDIDQFREELNDPAMWGGAGSVSDVGPRSGHFIDERSAEEDEYRYRDLMVRFVEQLDREGLASDRARSIAATFREWNESGI